MRARLLAAVAAVTFPFPILAELKPAKEPIESAGTQRTYIFKSTPQGDLKVHVFLPPDWKAGQKRPAILMLFGGGFTGGSPDQFLTKAPYLASRGMVAITPEYRIKTKHKTTPEQSIEDGKSAFRWARMNAKELGIDAGRLVGAGGSAGGTAAALAAWSEAFEAEGEDRSVSSRPDALVLYNAALRAPEDAEEMSILKSWTLRKGGPPMIMFFGTEDKWLKPALGIARQYAAMGNRAELYTAAGQKHGFFNDAKTAKNGSPGWHEVVLQQTDLFLASLGYLKGRPTVKLPDASLVLDRVQLGSGGGPSGGR